MTDIPLRLVSDRHYLGEGEDDMMVLEPGDLYWMVEHEPARKGGGPCPDWDNCDGKHLYVTLPVKFRPDLSWYATTDLTGRVQNCSRKGDRVHRCRKILGDIPNITLASGCAVGCSIGYPWPDMLFHGFIRNGRLVA